ncbi:MAG: hypothetical protein COV72_00925 [Candidatus Omnitrophica bacterium CG11_big_fil_rev_8_21_14_0_20_42_13]|uniref:Coenzyme Q-binding protein COQ10 START domain-containing protein n=1 Tax=Candidatus Ghiorseimicrobium undicola TaxID=1974746 RepID=A0A2H0LZN0_9BACT|nr:MAG: hypothetical protein COV72_00925 [Candidatus Omnitrophica bacterium CG11_big_fil_rev_8_21_14_0_20_42_13]
MQPDELIHIEVSRVIPAKKYNIIRFLTRVWEFPTYIPTVKEANVVEKKHNIMKTKWSIQVEGIPLTWIEEDTLDLKDDSVYFKSIEGDLQEFHGSWKFEDHLEGTNVIVGVYLRVGIPAIKDFAESYVKNVVTRNFEAILEAFERRAISMRYHSFKQGNLDKLAGFGVLGHFYNFNHLAKCLMTLNPEFKMPSPEFLSKLFSMTPSFKMHEMKEFKSASGAATHGCFIVCTFVPEMLEQDLHAVYSKVVRACKIAEKHGVGIVALGGFTSVVGERLGHQISEEVDIPITTGNTYTAALAIDGVEKAARLLGKELKDLRVTIVGGTGDIGSACARVLAGEVKELTITGRTKSNLRRLRAELRKTRRAMIKATTNNLKAVKNADIIIACATSVSAILDISWFKPGAIICDLGYPKNISYTPTNRKDIIVFSGGLASVPTPINTGVDMGLPSTDISYGCFSEAIILALEKRFENFSYGRGNIMPEKINEIRVLGAKHGFKLAPFYWANRLITEEDFEEVKRAINNA